MRGLSVAQTTHSRIRECEWICFNLQLCTNLYILHHKVVEIPSVDELSQCRKHSLESDCSQAITRSQTCSRTPSMFQTWCFLAQSQRCLRVFHGAVSSLGDSGLSLWCYCPGLRVARHRHTCYHFRELLCGDCSDEVPGFFFLLRRLHSHLGTNLAFAICFKTFGIGN